MGPFPVLMIYSLSIIITPSLADTFICDDPYECEYDTLSCKDGEDCHIFCTGDYSCSGANIYCPSDNSNSTCNLYCNAATSYLNFSNIDGCDYMYISGGSGDLIITAQGKNYIMYQTAIYCGSGDCNITCIGNDIISEYVCGYIDIYGFSYGSGSPQSVLNVNAFGPSSLYASYIRCPSSIGQGLYPTNCFITAHSLFILLCVIHYVFIYVPNNVFCIQINVKMQVRKLWGIW